MGTTVINDPRDTEAAKRLGLRIRGQLAENGYNQRDLAEFMHLSPAGISRRLTGDVDITYTELLRIARFLRTDICALLPRKDSNLQPAVNRWLRAA